MQEVDISDFKNQRLELLGLLGSPEAELNLAQVKQIQKAELEIYQIASPRYVYKTFARDELKDSLEGKDIHLHLGTCDRVMLLAASLGAKVDFAIRRAQALSMPYAMILDAVASVSIEKYLDKVEAELRFRLREKDLYLSSRYAPGYGDMPLSVLADLLNKLDAYSAISLSYNNQGLMNPLKSILAVLGLSDSEQMADLGLGDSETYPCDNCQYNQGCALKARGAYCGRYSKRKV